MNVQDQLKEFLRGSIGPELDPPLRQKVETLFQAEGPKTEVSYDLVMGLTKFVEIELREITQRFRGEKLVPKLAGGEELLSVMKDSRLFVQEPPFEPLWYLAKYVFAERNPAHHEDAEYDWPHFVAFLSSASLLLTQMRLRGATYPLPTEMILTTTPIVCHVGQPLSITVEIPAPHTGVPITGGTCTAAFHFEPGTERNKEMVFSAAQKKWTAELGTGSAELGMFHYFVESKSEAGHFVSKKPGKGEIVP